LLTSPWRATSTGWCSGERCSASRGMRWNGPQRPSPPTARPCRRASSPCAAIWSRCQPERRQTCFPAVRRGAVHHGNEVSSCVRQITVPRRYKVVQKGSLPAGLQCTGINAILTTCVRRCRRPKAPCRERGKSSSKPSATGCVAAGRARLRNSLRGCRRRDGVLSWPNASWRCSVQVWRPGKFFRDFSAARRYNGQRCRDVCAEPRDRRRTASWLAPQLESQVKGRHAKTRPAAGSAPRQVLSQAPLWVPGADEEGDAGSQRVLQACCACR